MIARARTPLRRLAALLGVALFVVGCVGCDPGGLLVATENPSEKPPVKGHSSTELVNGGTVASNGKYKVFYVLGQPSPLQGTATSPDHRVNGGLTGAVQGE
jgi:hypothetical protein